MNSFINWLWSSSQLLIIMTILNKKPKLNNLNHTYSASLKQNTYDLNYDADMTTNLMK